MISRTSARFWKCYECLPERFRRLAQKNFALWTTDPWHPSLRFKEVKRGVWSVRVGLDYRALAAFDGTAYVWFWIGTHDEYLRMIESL